MNMQPSEAEAGFNIRLPPTADPDLMRKRIAEEWAPATRNMTYEVSSGVLLISMLYKLNVEMEMKMIFFFFGSDGACVNLIVLMLDMISTIFIYFCC